MADASLRGLVLEEHGYVTDYEICYEDFKDIYDPLDSADLEEKICVQYEEAYVDILKFMNEGLLRDNLENIIRCKGSYNQENSSCISSAFIRDGYAVFIYSLKKRAHPRLELVDAYKRLGFREV